MRFGLQVWRFLNRARDIRVRLQCCTVTFHIPLGIYLTSFSARNRLVLTRPPESVPSIGSRRFTPIWLWYFYYIPNDDNISLDSAFFASQCGLVFAKPGCWTSVVVPLEQAHRGALLGLRLEAPTVWRRPSPDEAVCRPRWLPAGTVVPVIIDWRWRSCRSALLDDIFLPSYETFDRDRRRAFRSLRKGS